MTFRKLLATSALALTLGTGTALADPDGGPQNSGDRPVSNGAHIAADTTSSSGGILVPLLLLVIVAAAAAS